MESKRRFLRIRHPHRSCSNDGDGCRNEPCPVPGPHGTAGGHAETDPVCSIRAGHQAVGRLNRSHGPLVLLKECWERWYRCSLHHVSALKSSGTIRALWTVFDRLSTGSDIQEPNETNTLAIRAGLHTGGVVGSIPTAPTITLRKSTKPCRASCLHQRNQIGRAHV